jgi:hypothetical protein
LNFQITPNPASEFTSVIFDNSKTDIKSIIIYDIEGREIKHFDYVDFNLVQDYLTWDLTNNCRNKVEDGLYFISIRQSEYKVTQKIAILKN